MRRFAAALLAFSLIASSAQADTKAARAYVDGIAAKALDIVKTSDSLPAKQDRLEKMFSSVVDIPFIGRFVLGRHWNTITPEQQKEYLAAYEPFLLKGYVGRIAKYSGQSYRITNARNDGEHTLVTMEIIDPGNPSVFVDYRLRQQGKDFKVTDIVVEGVSLLNTQRSEFNAVMRNRGIEHLINALKQKAAANTAA